ncbi:cytochrome c oxidase subunit 4 isoform 1, mitochondrial [Galendromus occidentalis]|uniref:Cytochrome c oxidase subunit 4 n=1 Tax=Galendromus occidentalis TaxID=34638 RepID=A0AAJ6QSK6_9ACAR|nr:cytochrome c oxidase subunit 4 isoform 1, mitochondrial [Galendromus occidentalis]
MSLLKPKLLCTLLARRTFHGRAQIGKREVVGHGLNGTYSYLDRADCPYPAIRWEEPGSHIDALLQKQKGDWKNLSLEEKKALYRHSFRQTFVEFDSPRGDWRIITGGVMFGLAFALWMSILLKKFVLPPLPESCSEESKQAQLKRMIEIRANPVEGIASKWDYENNRWK